MKTAKSNVVNDQIETEIQTLEARRNMLIELRNKKESLESEISRLVGGGKVSATMMKSPDAPRKLDLPRGVITMTAYQIIRKNNKPMHVKDVIEAVKRNPSIGEVENLERKIRGILNTSEYFENVGRGTFKPSKKEPSGTLFERVGRQLQAA